MGGINDSRIITVDAVRGFAVLGILLMNIVSFALPIEAYNNPTAFGGTSNADLIAWTVMFGVADGKMRGLFTLLFGAGVAIIADRAETAGQSPSAVHYRRMFWLLIIGMLHGSLIWYGDILVEYALTGAFIFLVWRWRPSALLYAAAMLFLLGMVIDAFEWRGLIALKAAAVAEGAHASDRTYWLSLVTPDLQTIASEVAHYRGGVGSIMTQRLHDLGELLTGMPIVLIESLSTSVFGIALYQMGYFTDWTSAAHSRLILAGYAIALPAAFLLAAFTAYQHFDPVALAFATLGNGVLRPLIILAHASVIILLVQQGTAARAVERLAAAGRMALSNYLATSIAMTSLFYGTGLGLFGTLPRATLYAVVPMMWIMILLWSKPWLHYFRYGPAEWVWRSLARGRPVPLLIKNQPPHQLSG